MIPVDLPPDPTAELVRYAQEACGADEVRVEHLGFDPGRLGDAHSLHFSGDPCRPSPQLRVRADHDGVTLAAWSFRPRLEIFVTVPVATVAVARGEAVHTQPGRASLRSVIGDPVQPGTWTARVALSAGDPVTTAVVSETPQVTKGSAVTLRLSRGAVALSATGRLLTDGRVGQEVRAINEATNAAIRGVLVDPTTVEVR